ncbi:WGR domain-containing protein [Ochrobactrum sp. GPK 3]|uniref:WGR domain-containing protein n=1 Tax=Brucella sp. 22210 TaxID=3453892 RepID=UPI0031385A13
MIAQQFHLYVERIDPNKNIARYYAMHISYSLFGEPCLTRQWGRIGASGQVKLQHFEHETEAVQLFLTLARKKQMRGYKSRRLSPDNSV